MTVSKLSLKEAEEADLQEWKSMTPAERLDLVQFLRDLYYEFKNEGRKAFKEFIGSLNNNNVRYLIIGNFALSDYAEPRYTKDIDILVDAAPSNADRPHEYGDIPAYDISKQDLIDQNKLVGRKQDLADIVKPTKAWIHRSGAPRRPDQTLRMAGRPFLVLGGVAPTRSCPLLAA